MIIALANERLLLYGEHVFDPIKLMCFNSGTLILFLVLSCFILFCVYWLMYEFRWGFRLVTVILSYCCMCWQKRSLCMQGICMHFAFFSFMIAMDVPSVDDCWRLLFWRLWTSAFIQYIFRTIQGYSIMQLYFCWGWILDL